MWGFWGTLMALNTTLPSLAQSQSLLTPAQSDQSVGFLNHLFGIQNGNWHSLYYQAIGGIGNGSLFFHLLQDFDLVVLAFVTIMVFITLGIGATSTAHEGKAFGSRYHALWTPLRSAFAMVLLAPIPGVGLSLIQGALLLMVWFSIGGANYLATQATSYMVKQGGVISGMTPTGGTKLAQDILQSEITDQYIVNYDMLTTPKRKPALDTVSWTPSSPEMGSYGAWTFTFTVPPGSGLAPGQLGTISVPCFSQGGPMCTARKDAVSQMISVEYKYAQSLVNSSQAAPGSSSVAPVIKPATSAPSATDPVVAQAAQIYDSAEAGAVPAEIALSNPEIQKELTTLNQNVTNFGWMSLGTFYWDIAAVNEKVQTRIGQVTHWRGYDSSAITKELGPTDTKRLGSIINTATAAILASQTPQAAQQSNSIIDKVFSTDGALLYAGGTADLLLKGDPVANLQRVGDWIVSAEVPAAIAAVAESRVLAEMARKAAGVFNKIPGVGAVDGAPSALVKALSPYLMMLIVGIFAIGVVWAYYIPSVPFIIWTMAIIGWLIFIVEALVGSVIWAAGIALPEGEGIFGPRGDQGVMLFINIMFRPALMVIGFFASFLLIGIVGNWVGASVTVFMGSMNGAMEWNPITWVASAVIIAAIAVVITHRIFSLILWVPDNVLRWVGGQGPQLGDEGHEQQTRSVFAGFASSKSGAAQAALGGKKSQDGAPDKKAENQGGADAAQGGNFKKNDVADGGEKTTDLDVK